MCVWKLMISRQPCYILVGKTLNHHRIQTSIWKGMCCWVSFCMYVYIILYCRYYFPRTSAGGGWRVGLLLVVPTMPFGHRFIWKPHTKTPQTCACRSLSSGSKWGGPKSRKAQSCALPKTPLPSLKPCGLWRFAEERLRGMERRREEMKRSE